MQYPWQCNTCNHVTDANRSVADMDRPPDLGCEKCTGTDLKRIIVRPKQVKGYVLEGTGWHETDYGPRGPRR